jgi:DNA-binding MarR family transcriptional regulator
MGKRPQPGEGFSVPVPPVIGTGFLLSSLGVHSAHEYAARIEPIGLTPPHVGILRAIAITPGRSQQSIAEEFGMPPSRLVAFLDDLEDKKLVERRRDPHDRRVHLLHLTATGGTLMRELAVIGQENETALLGSLSELERDQLHELLARVAEDQGLTPGVHPGYRRLRSGDSAPDCPPAGHGEPHH